MKPRWSCILLSGAPTHLANAARDYADSLFDLRVFSTYQRSDKKLAAEVIAAVDQEPPDFLFSLSVPVIIPGKILSRIKRAAINFHPGPPDYPGIGCASYALYDGAALFGVTAHLMEERVDSGAILRVLRFPIHARDTCERVFDRCLNYALFLYYDLLGDLARDGEVLPCGEQWQRKAVSRAQFERWMVLSTSDSTEEIARKVRALRHSRFPGPFLDHAGLRFQLPPAPGVQSA